MMDIAPCNSGFHTLDPGFQVMVPDSVSVELGFRINFNRQWDTGFP